MVFNTAKFEAISFAWKCNLLNPDIVLPNFPFDLDHSIVEIVKSILQETFMRLFGMYYDSNLLFKRHIRKIASKNQKAVTSLQMLGNTIGKIEIKVIYQTVLICILLLLINAMPTWCPGQTHLNIYGKTICKDVRS